jgi:hypothetical protein
MTAPTPATHPPNPVPAPGGRPSGPSTATGPPAPPPANASDTEFLAWLRSLVGTDGTFRVSRLVIADSDGAECIVLQRQRYRAEIVVSIPSPPGQSTDVTLYAENGDPDCPTVEPSLGAAIRVGGDEVADVDVVVDRWGGWELSVNRENSGSGDRRPR